jgi:hypothetical protein
MPPQEEQEQEEQRQQPQLSPQQQWQQAHQQPAGMVVGAVAEPSRLPLTPAPADLAAAGSEPQAEAASVAPEEGPGQPPAAVPAADTLEPQQQAQQQQHEQQQEQELVVGAQRQALPAAAAEQGPPAAAATGEQQQQQSPAVKEEEEEAEGVQQQQTAAAAAAEEQHQQQQADAGACAPAATGSPQVVAQPSPGLAAVRAAAEQHVLQQAVAAFQTADTASSDSMLRPLRRVLLAGKGGATLAEVVGSWGSYPLARQQDLFSLAVLAASGGRWDELEGSLSLALDPAAA